VPGRGAGPGAGACAGPGAGACARPAAAHDGAAAAAAGHYRAAAAAAAAAASHDSGAASTSAHNGAAAAAASHGGPASSSPLRLHLRHPRLPYHLLRRQVGPRGQSVGRGLCDLLAVRPVGRVGDCLPRGHALQRGPRVLRLARECGVWDGTGADADADADRDRDANPHRAGDARPDAAFPAPSARPPAGDRLPALTVQGVWMVVAGRGGRERTSRLSCRALPTPPSPLLHRTSASA